MVHSFALRPRPDTFASMSSASKDDTAVGVPVSHPGGVMVLGAWPWFCLRCYYMLLYVIRIFRIFGYFWPFLRDLFYFYLLLRASEVLCCFANRTGKSKFWIT